MLDFPAFGWLTGGCLETSLHYLHGVAAVSRAKKPRAIEPRVATPSPQTARGSEAGKEGIASYIARARTLGPLRGTTPFNCVRAGPRSSSFGQ